jgi:hypothetical protein
LWKKGANRIKSNDSESRSEKEYKLPVTNRVQVCSELQATKRDGRKLEKLTINRKREKLTMGIKPSNTSIVCMPHSPLNAARQAKMGLKMKRVRTTKHPWIAASCTHPSL